MITALSKGEIIDISGKNGTVFIAPYKCLVTVNVKSLNSFENQFKIITKRRNGVNISLITWRSFVTNIVALDVGETVFSSGVQGDHSLLVMRLL